MNDSSNKTTQKLFQAGDYHSSWVTSTVFHKEAGLDSDYSIEVNDEYCQL